MKKLNKQVGIAAVLGIGMVFAGVAAATTVTMGFDELEIGNGINQGQYVASYYNGGCGTAFNSGPVTCGGPDYGVTWTGAAVANGGLQAGDDMPTPPNILVGRVEPGNVGGPQPIITMNVANGFTSGFSFWYSSGSVTTNINLWSGLDGTGDLLASTGNLPRTPTACLPHSGLFACWNFVDDLAYSGVVHSVTFSAPFNTTGFDDVSFDMRSLSVPEPAVLGTFGLGALLIGLFAGFRRRFN